MAIVRIAVVGVVILVAPLRVSTAQQIDADVLLHGGAILDGTGSEAFDGHVALSG